MDITISEKAREQLKQDGSKNLRIFLKGYGWAGPTFGLAQAEPEDGDKTLTVDDMNFVVEGEVYDLVNSFEIDYYKGVFQKGYVVYANGNRGSC